MKIFENLKAKWKSMTPAEKLKVVLEGICNVGADLMMGYLNTRLIPGNDKKWKKAACIITTGGLGMAVGKLASQNINEMIDVFTDLKTPQEEKDA